MLFASDGSTGIYFPAGWTELFRTANGGDCTLAAYYRIADGEEGATIQVTTSGSQQTAHTSYRLTSTGEFNIDVGTAATGTSVNPDPPSLTSEYGTRDYVWFAICGYDRNRTVSSYPTDYTDGRCDYANNSYGCGVGSARRELNEETEDPAAFTISSSDQWVANTIAIAGPAAPPPSYIPRHSEVGSSDVRS